MTINKRKIEFIVFYFIFLSINKMEIKAYKTDHDKQIIVSPKKQIVDNINSLNIEIKQLENKLSKKNKTDEEKMEAIKNINTLKNVKQTMQNVIKYPDIVSITAIASQAISTVIMTAWQFKKNPVEALIIAFGYTEQQAKEIFYLTIKEFQKKLNENSDMYPDKLNDIRTAKNASEINKAGEKLMQNVKSNLAFDVFANMDLNKLIGN